MSNPLFWLGLSFLLLALCLTALLFVSIPTLLELARAARSAEKLLDSLNRELPSTLNALKQTGSGLSDLADEVTDGVQSANQLVKQVDQGLDEVRQQAHRAHITTRSTWVGLQAAWQVLTDQQPRKKRRRRPPTRRPSSLTAEPKSSRSISTPPEASNPSQGSSSEQHIQSKKTTSGRRDPHE